MVDADEYRWRNRHIPMVLRDIFNSVSIYSLCVFCVPVQLWVEGSNSIPVKVPAFAELELWYRKQDKDGKKCIMIQTLITPIGVGIWSVGDGAW